VSESFTPASPHPSTPSSSPHAAGSWRGARASNRVDGAGNIRDTSGGQFGTTPGRYTLRFSLDTDGTKLIDITVVVV
jgi:hypothetical protein